MRPSICICICLAIFGALTFWPTPVTTQAPAALDELIDGAMKQWQVPGLSIVIVRDDRIVYLKGFGVRSARKPESVTPDTIFPIASCTKSFTTLAMGMLVDEEKLAWDDPVRKHVDYFRLEDPLANASVTLRDLVCHRTGVGSHDLLWYKGPWSLGDRIRHACKLDQVLPFRASFRYQVVYFGAAGVAVGNAAGTSWQEFVQERVLQPLDMKASTCTFPQSAVDVASPHRKEANGQVVVMPRYPLDEADPSGSIHATARDLGQYLRFQLGDGTWQGKRLISAASLAEPHTPQVVLRLAGAARAMNPETLFLHYGMGWIVQDYRGKKLLMHGGSIDGFRAHLTLVPELRLGIALLTNLDGGLVNVSLSNSIIDQVLGVPAKDWSSYYLKLYEDGEREDRDHAKAIRDKRGPDLGPPRPLKAYTGTFNDPAYGDCKLEVSDGKLVWHWGKMSCPLEHYQGDLFLANYGPLVDAGFAFRADRSGTVDAFRAFDRVFRRKD
jgi:CubicO group peptidase (beta-lactamase class C family)